MKKILLLGIVLTTFVACSEKSVSVNYDKTVIANYYLRTDFNNFVTGEVNIRHENDTIFPTIESVTLEGKSMGSSVRNKMLRYRIDQEMPVANDYEFVINHKDVQSISTILSINPINKISIKEGVMSKTNGFNLAWKGDKIAPNNETLVLLITDSKGQSMSLNHIGETKISGIFIDPVQLQYFETGPATIYLVRKTLIDLGQEGYVKRKAEIEYYTDELKLEIVE